MMKLFAISRSKSISFIKNENMINNFSRMYHSNQTGDKNESFKYILFTGFASVITLVVI